LQQVQLCTYSGGSSSSRSYIRPVTLAAFAAASRRRCSRRSCKASEAEEPDPEECDSLEIKESDNRRLDVFLSEHYEQSRSYFGKLIDQKAVLVNGRATKKSFRSFKAGDVIDIRFLVEDQVMRPEPMDLDVLYEDDDILVVNKAPGVCVHPAAGHWTGTLVNGVMHHLGFVSAEDSSLPPAKPGPASKLRPGIVHRLDIGTSGCIAVAKNSLALDSISKAFAAREVQKTYLAVVFGGRKCFCGYSAGSGHVIDKPIGRSRKERQRMAIVDEVGGGRPSMSVVRSIARAQELHLLEVRPRTGRTHQIRVHLAEEQSPVLGDEAYGWARANHRYRGLAERTLLHAFSLAFKHPRTGEPLFFEAPLHDDFKKAIETMQPLEEEAATIRRLLEPSASEEVPLPDPPLPNINVVKQRAKVHVGV